MTTSGRPVEQRADIDGSGNVIVQMLGNNNQVDFGRAYLKLTRYLTRRRVDSEADLLSPYARSIPLVGRQPEIAELRAWLASEKPIAVTGRAGAGKTRLSLELCEQMLGEGWAAGFLESEELRRFQDKQNLADWGSGRPTLIVVDHAAVHAERLGHWLAELADNPGAHDKPLRLLLLERQAEAGAGWWQTAFGRGGFGARAVRKLLDPAEPIILPPLTATDERRAVFGATLEQAGSDLRPPEPGSNPDFDRQLAELTWGGEPLFLMMAGLVAKEAGVGAILALGRTDLAFELADRELARIARIGQANGIHPGFLTVMAGHATLCRGLAAPAIRAAVPAEQAALGLPGAGDPGDVAKALAEGLPGGNGGADPILPDIIGEAALLRAFADYDDDGAAAVCRAFAAVGQEVAATVIRTAQDFAGAGHEAPLAWLDALGRSVDVDQLMMIANDLPENTLALREQRARIHGAIAEVLRDEVAGGSVERLPSLAMGLNNLSNSLSDLGRREDALAAAEEARDLYRELAAARPDAFKPDLAMALNTLANRLSEIHRREDALAAALEAVRLRRALAAARPDACNPALASALNNLANCLSKIGRAQDALVAAEEARDLYCALAAAQSETFTPDLAMALHNLAIRLSEIDRLHDALAAAEEAVRLRRALAAARPDAFTPNFAISLAMLAGCLDKVARASDALDANRHAIAALRAPFLAHPAAFAHRMMPMCRLYIDRCEKLGQEPDGELLGPVADALRRLQQNEP